MTKDERMVMNALSKEVYGTTSHWQKVMKYGERIKVMSKNKKGEEIEVGYYQHPTVEELCEGLKRRAKEMADEKLLKEQKNARSVGESNTSGSGEGTGPVGSPTEGGSEGTGI